MKNQNLVVRFGNISFIFHKHPHDNGSNLGNLTQNQKKMA
jgi:hypothetical protein